MTIILSHEKTVYPPNIFEMFELCMSGQAFKIFRLSSLAQTMNAFIGLLMCSPSFFCCRIIRPVISQTNYNILYSGIVTILCSAVYNNHGFWPNVCGFTLTSVTSVVEEFDILINVTPSCEKKLKMYVKYRTVILWLDNKSFFIAYVDLRYRNFPDTLGMPSTVTSYPCRAIGLLCSLEFNKKHHICRQQYNITILIWLRE